MMIKWLIRLLWSNKKLNSVREEKVEIDQILAWEMYMQEYGA